MDATDTINQKPKIRLNLKPLAHPANSPLTFYSSLSPKGSGMLGLNAVAAVSQEIAASVGIMPARSPVQPVDAVRGNSQGQTPQRSLESVPPAPLQPMPRGSLLDLRV